MLGDELDGPRGRIYQIKDILEGHPATRKTQQHLDQCLTCRSCETTCPSGVEYARLLDIGRQEVEKQVRRPREERRLRRLLNLVLPYSGRLRLMLRLGHQFRRYLPANLARHIPERLPGHFSADQWPAPRHQRRMILLDGCAQPVYRPSINLAAARVLDQQGISLIRIGDAGCCGAVSHHLTRTDSAHEHIRRNISAWWRYLENGVEAIISTSSACSLMLREYAHIMRDDPSYAEKAIHISEKVRDLAEVLDPARIPSSPQSGTRLAFQVPCTAQHGQNLTPVIETALQNAGYELTRVPNGHLCCGAAGTYTVLQPELSEKLRSEKLAALSTDDPELIATANIGCMLHLQEATSVPVHHWIELIDSALKRPA